MIKNVTLTNAEPVPVRATTVPRPGARYPVSHLSINCNRGEIRQGFVTFITRTCDTEGAKLYKRHTRIGKTQCCFVARGKSTDTVRFKISFSDSTTPGTEDKTDGVKQDMSRTENPRYYYRTAPVDFVDRETPTCSYLRAPTASSPTSLPFSKLMPTVLHEPLWLRSRRRP